MGRSKGARKKAGIKPWHSVYVRLNLPGLIVGVIPKRIRAIEGAKARLKIARTVRAAAVEWRHIDTNLSAIDGAYSKIRTALRDGYVLVVSLLSFVCTSIRSSFPATKVQRICSHPSFFFELLPPRFCHLSQECSMLI